jgi:hypothetical protein
MLMITCGFTVLLSTTYYQCNLLQQLLVPKQPPKLSIEEVTNHIATHKSTVHISYDGMLEQIEKSGFTALTNALQKNPPRVHTPEVGTMKDVIDKNVIIIVDIPTIHQLLSQLDPNECAKYVVIELPQIVPAWLTLMLHEERRDLQETLNAIVAERMNFIDDLIDQSLLTDECRNHIYPPNIPEQKFTPLSFYTLSSIFFIVLCLCIVSFIALICEIVINKRTPTNMSSSPLKSYCLNYNLEAIQPRRRDEVMHLYYKLRDLIDTCKQ